MRTNTQQTRSRLSLLALAATLGLAMAFTFNACSSDGNDDSPSSSSGGTNVSSSSITITKGTPVTDVDGQIYETVVIGTQTWMAKNLNRNIDTDTTVSVCLYNDTVNCTKYGRLYNWVTAMALPSSCDTIKCTVQIQAKHKGICPAGWHIPSNDDWEKLMRYVDGSTGTSNDYNSSPTAGKNLKAKSGWNDGGNGTDDYGFSALPGGLYEVYEDEDGNYGFFDGGYSGSWWSSSADMSYSPDAYFWTMHCHYNSDKAERYMSDHNYFSVRCVKD